MVKTTGILDAAMELRSPRPFTMEGFIEFNRGYCAVLEAWGVFVDGVNPIARTNVCPVSLDSSEPVLHAFSLVRPNAALHRQTFNWPCARFGLPGSLNVLPSAPLRAEFGLCYEQPLS